MRKEKTLSASTTSPSWHQSGGRFCIDLFILGSAQGPTEPMGILPFQHLQTPVTSLQPNQHLVISINSAQSGHTLDLCQEKCQSLLREPRANGLGIRFHWPVWASRECLGSCPCQAAGLQKRDIAAEKAAQRSLNALESVSLSLFPPPPSS